MIVRIFRVAIILAAFALLASLVGGILLSLISYVVATVRHAQLAWPLISLVLFVALLAYCTVVKKLKF